MRWLWRTYLAGAAIIVGAFPLVSSSTQPWLFDGLSLASAAAILVVGRLRRLPHARSWMLVGAGQLAFAVGDVIFDYLENVAGDDPFPSVADVSYVAGYLFLAIALTGFVRDLCPGRDVPSLLDASIVTVGVGVVCWVYLVVPYARDPALTPLQGALSAAYPLFDLLLLGLLVRLTFTPCRTPRPYRLLALGVLAHLAADTGYAVKVLVDRDTATSVVLDVGWLVGYALMVAAVFHPFATDAAPPPVAASELTRRRLTILAGASILAPTVLAVQSVAGAPVQGLFIAGASIVLFLLVVLRMLGLLYQVREQSSALAALAESDGLTGIANRRSWDVRLAAELARAGRAGVPTCVALVDLDHFKRYNDAHGHPAGDELLANVAAAWRGALRAGDLLARYGGEEFAVLLPDCDLPHAVPLLERLRRLVPDRQTCSIGVTQWDGTEAPAAVVARADRGLYQAKRQGRDRTVHLPATTPSAVANADRPLVTAP